MEWDRAEGISGTGRQTLHFAWMACESKTREYTRLLEVCTQICRWSNMSAKVQSEEWQQKKKRGKQSFLKCMYSRAQSDKVRQRISPIKELAGRGVGSSWLARPYHRRMSSACMGKPPCSHSSRGEVERLCAENTSARWACFRWHGLWNHTSAWRTDRKSVNLTKSNPKSNPL